MQAAILVYMRVACVFSLSARVLVSPRTPFDYHSVVESVLLKSPADFSLSLSELPERRDVQQWDEEVLIDWVFDEGLSGAVGDANDARAVRLWGAAWGKQYFDEMARFAIALNFSGITVITDTAPSNQAAAHSLVSEYPQVFREIQSIPQSSSFNFTHQFVMRSIKPRGISMLSILTDPVTANSLLAALSSARMLRSGHYCLLSQESAWYRGLQHAVAVAGDSGVMFVGDQYAREKTRVLAETKRLIGIFRQAVSDPFTPSPQTFSLFAVNSTDAVVLAKSPRDVPLLRISQQTSKASIRASVNYRALNPDSSEFPLGPQIMRGFSVAFNEVNNRSDVIPDYHMEDYSVGFTGLIFGYNFSRAKVTAGRSDLGVVYLSVPLSASIMGMSKVFADLNITMPIVAGSAATPLSDPKAFPLFLRSRSGTTYSVTVLARLIRFWGWSHVAVLYSLDKGDMEDIYRQFVIVASTLGINITNSEEGRKLPNALSDATAAAVNASLAEIKASTTRVILVLHNLQYVIMEQMYDLGMKEEYVQLHLTGLTDALFQDPKYYKRRAVSKGAIMIFLKLFVGDVGAKVKQELIKRDGNGVYSNTCFFYDAAYLYFYAIDYLLQRGLDYEDPLVLVKAMRETHFQGCAGLCRIETGANDRTPGEIVITNFQYNSEEDTYVLKEVGSYNPFSAQLYQLTEKVQWPDGKDSYPDLKPMYRNCAYLAETVRDSPSSRAVSTSLISFLCAYTFLICVYILRKWRSRETQPLRTKSPISLEDSVQMGSVATDYIQLAALGPDLSALSLSLARVCDVAVFRYQISVWDAGEIFWLKVNVASVLATVLVVLFALKRCGMQGRISKLLCSMDGMIEMMIPNVLYVPILWTLESVFLCRKGISDEVTDSFFDTDCSEFCWADRHLCYGVIAFLVLICYIPAAVQVRLTWQELQVNIHIKTLPLALTMKSVMDVVLVALALFLKPEDPVTHAYAYFAIVAAYLGLLLKFHQYNYARLNLWHFLSIVSLLLLASAAHLASQFTAEYTQYILLGVFVSFCGLAVFGLLLQRVDSRFESKLEREKNRDVRGLFTFAFTGGERAKEGLEQFYEVNHVQAKSRRSSVTSVDLSITK